MKNYKTKGIVLKRTNLGEADRILTIFTEKRGKVKVIAKGIRKTLSKFAGHLEPFCLSNLVIAEGRNLDIITDAETVKCFFKLRSNLSSTNNAYFLAEIIDKMTVENETHPEVFNLLENVLENLNNGLSELLLSYFVINFLSDIGYQPELYACLKCDKKIEAGKNYFDLDSGGLICAGHQNIIARPISDKAIKVLRLFLKHQISIIDKLKTDEKLTKEIKNITSDYLRHTSQKEFKSEKFLERK